MITKKRLNKEFNIKNKYKYFRYKCTFKPYLNSMKPFMYVNKCYNGKNQMILILAYNKCNFRWSFSLFFKIIKIS